MGTPPHPPRPAGQTATFWAVLVIFGLLVIIGVILWMVKKEPSVKHSPQQTSYALPAHCALFSNC